MQETNIKISICITQYNENINTLLGELCIEIDTYELPVNIYVGDDNSNYNYPINVDKSYLNIRKNIRNMGRAANRNKIAADADGQYILFLDGDILPSSSHFLRKYLKYIKNNTCRVLSGGVSYPEKKPHKTHLLHYRYGVNRESKKNYNAHLKTANLLIERQLFRSLEFDESLAQYGHEDTILSHQLHTLNISFRWIDNAVIHRGIIKNKEFLRKQEEALKSLIQLKEKGITRLTHLQVTYENRYIHLILSILSIFPASNILKWLLLSFPSINLKVLDLYKVIYYHKLLSKK